MIKNEILTIHGSKSKNEKPIKLLSIKKTDNPNIILMEIAIEREIYEGLNNKKTDDLYSYLIKILKRNAKE